MKIDAFIFFRASYPRAFLLCTAAAIFILSMELVPNAAGQEPQKPLEQSDPADARDPNAGDHDPEIDAKMKKLADLKVELRKAVEAGKLDEETAERKLATAEQELFPERPQAPKNWIERNLILFITLIHLGWIIPTFGGIAIWHVVSKRREQKRTEALAATINEMGLLFEPDGDAFHQSLPRFPLLEIGRSRQLTNLIQADTPDLKMGIFDYRYVTGRGRNKRIRRLSVVAVESADLKMPRCHLRPENRWLDGIGALFGKQDIDFADHAEFSKAFVLKSKEETETRNFFDQGLLDYFSQCPDVSFEAQPGSFLYFRQWKRVEPEINALKEFLSEGLALFAAIQERQSRPSL